MTNLTKATFDDFLKNSTKPVVVDFWASWCTPCQMLTPVMDELSTEMADQVTIAKVNVDDEADLAQRYQVSSIPAVHIFKNGNSVANNLGFMPKDNYKKFIEESIK